MIDQNTFKLTVFVQNVFEHIFEQILIIFDHHISIIFNHISIIFEQNSIISERISNIFDHIFIFSNLLE